ncbi:MAG: heme exporter protein CcmD [Rhizobiaceae bacterium]
MFGEHASFILPAYLITASVLAATTLTIVLNYKARKTEIKLLENEQQK